MERGRRAGANRAPVGDSQLGKFIPNRSVICYNKRTQEQYQVWTRTQGHLQKFMTARAEDNTVEKISKVNRYIGKFPTSEDMIKTSDMLDNYKHLKMKLTDSLESTKVAAEKESK